VTARLELDYDDSLARPALLRLEGRLRDPGGLLQSIGAALVASTRLRFKIDQRGPDGVSWSKSARAAAGGTNTLVRSGRLLRSIAARVRGDTVEVGTNVKYAAAHQFGAQTKATIIRPRRGKALKFKIGGVTIVRKSVNHPGSKIPARPFLGLSTGDRGTVDKLVGDWIRAAVP